MNKTNPLIDVAEFVRAHKRVAVIFDLDSTLFCVSPRTQSILRRLSQEPEFQKQFALESEILRDVEVLPTDWGVRAVLERVLVETPKLEFFLAVRDYWHQNFFSNHHLDQDILYPSANEYVRQLHSLGAEILYLTGRSDTSMRPGTIKALQTWGFPLSEDSRLIMKPSDVQTDESFKALVLKDLSRRFEHMWLFENEPVIIELVRKHVPQVRIVFVHSVHAGRAEPPIDLPTIGMDYSSGVVKNS